MIDVIQPNIYQRELTPALRRKLASLLSTAFADDTAMVEMLGKSQWRRIAKRYFAVQLDYSDTILVAEADGDIIAALLARSPDARPSWHSLWGNVYIHPR